MYTGSRPWSGLRHAQIILKVGRPERAIEGLPVCHRFTEKQMSLSRLFFKPDTVSRLALCNFTDMFFNTLSKQTGSVTLS
jgi:hypothetical protein